MPAYAPMPRAKRPEPGESRNPAIDALRGLAILCVVLLHVQIHIPQEQSLLGKVLPAPLFNIVFRSGYYGVIIFFVISGFLITRTCLARWGSLAAVPWAPFLCAGSPASIPACCCCCWCWRACIGRKCPAS